MLTNDTRGLWRGKRINNKEHNGEWVEGFLYPVRYSGYSIPGGADYYIVTCPSGGGRLQIQVDPSTFGECTGLRDKNGKLIFEGDILRKRAYGDITDYIVTWWKSNLSFILVYAFNPACHTDFITSFNSQTCEVIGNIHDNPELLKGADKP